MSVKIDSSQSVRDHRRPGDEAEKSYERWETESSLSGAMGMLAHTAYHLGEIRQATCTVKS